VFRIVKQKFSVTGMTCAACQANVLNSVQKLEGVIDASVNLISGSMTVDFDENTVNTDEIINAVVAIGYGAAVYSEQSDSSSKSEWDKRREKTIAADKALKKRVILSLCLLIPLMYIAMGHMIGLPLPWFLRGDRYCVYAAVIQLVIALSVMIINRKFFISGFRGIVKRAPNMDSLVAMGSAASFLYSLFSLCMMIYNTTNGNYAVAGGYYHHLYFESAAMILALVTVGKFLEARSKAKTTDSLEKLVNLAPKTALVVRDGKELTVSAEEIAVGDIIVIRPGDTIPADGVIVEGRGFINQSAVTGESLPVEKGIDDTVICATQNINGFFKFKALKVGSDTTLSQIIRLVDDAGNSKAPIARIADKVSGIFVPIVMLIAIITAAIWFLISGSAEAALTHAVSVLVISCPCALGLATPVAIMVGTGKAARMGILVHSAESLERLHSIDTVVFDKTGTLTEGTPVVTDVVLYSKSITKDEFLKRAASLESASTHPYALAVVNEYKKSASDFYEVMDFENISGRGIKGKILNEEIIAGNVSFMKESGVKLSIISKGLVDNFSKKGKTALLFAQDGVVIGVIALSDKIRESSFDGVSLLKQLNIKTVMLTGDNSAVAQSVKNELGIDDAVAEVMPADKEAYIRNLQSKGHHVAMLGDGINDAPALARADVGIAIGAGTDIAIETADVVLMKNSIYDAINAIKLSRAVIKNIKMNLFWAFFYNTIGIPVAAGALAFLGIHLSPMLGSAAMSLSSLFVVTNALRLRRFKGIEPENNVKEENNMKTVLKIEGMACGHCTARVEKALYEVEGVKSVLMSLEDGTATVECECDREVLVKVVEDAGYKVVG